MLKEVGASGQISLGKKYAGQLFDVVFAPDGRVELVPMKAVPTVQTELSTDATEAHRVQEELATYRVGDGWLTPERLAARQTAYARTPEQLAASKQAFEFIDKIKTRFETARSIINECNRRAMQDKSHLAVNLFCCADNVILFFR